MTAAPFSSASLMVGSEATIRASLFTTPSFTGTLRSSRISTRLPARSRSVIFKTVMESVLHLGWLVAAATSSQ